VFVDISGRTLPTFSWTAAYISNKGQFFLIFCTTAIFGRILELCYLETLKKTRLKIFCYRMQYRHSLRTVCDSLNEYHSPPLFLLICYRLIFQYHKCLYTYYPSCSLSDLFMYVWYWRENFIYKLWNLCSIPLYIFDNKICLNQRHVS
jgi:hypothetical protein